MDQPVGQDALTNYSHPFQVELFQQPNEKSADKAVLPEQLNTDRPQASHIVMDHLAKVAEHFENYANKLLGSIKDKESCKTDDNQNKQKCPFMRVASAVGFKYGGADKENPDEAGKRAQV